MAYRFLDIAATPSVRAAQAANGSGAFWANFKGGRAFDRFTELETRSIAERDSFYMATVSESGWPYVQHRGGPLGFLKVLDDKTLGFADFRGNRQYISLGNVAANEVHLINDCVVPWDAAPSVFAMPVEVSLPRTIRADNQTADSSRPRRPCELKYPLIFKRGRKPRRRLRFGVKVLRIARLAAAAWPLACWE